MLLTVMANFACHIGRVCRFRKATSVREGLDAVLACNFAA